MSAIFLDMRCVRRAADQVEVAIAKPPAFELVPDVMPSAAQIAVVTPTRCAMPVPSVDFSVVALLLIVVWIVSLFAVLT